MPKEIEMDKYKLELTLKMAKLLIYHTYKFRVPLQREMNIIKMSGSFRLELGLTPPFLFSNKK